MAVPDVPLHRAAPAGSVGIRPAGPVVRAGPTGRQRAAKVGSGWVQVKPPCPSPARPALMAERVGNPRRSDGGQREPAAVRDGGPEAGNGCRVGRWSSGCRTRWRRHGRSGRGGGQANRRAGVEVIPFGERELLYKRGRPVPEPHGVRGSRPVAGRSETACAPRRAQRFRGLRGSDNIPRDRSVVDPPPAIHSG